MDPILEAGTFTVNVGGIDWKMYRRSTWLMTKASGFRKVIGSISGADTAEKRKELKPEDVDAAGDFVRSVLTEALIEPRICRDGEEYIEGQQYPFDQIAAFHDVLFMAFMKSGHEAADFTKPSKGQTGQSS